MEELICPACKQQYTDNNPPRLLTMCGHTFCQQCLKSMIKRKDYRYQIKCPKDKNKLTIDTASAVQFPRNMILIEAMKKQKRLSQASEQKNEFLSEKDLQSGITTPITSRRSSVEEGVCLLHQKQLDIICLQEKILICAQCALFGLHKGHSFTTIKELQAKRNEWIHRISNIMQEKKEIQLKQIQKEVQNRINALLKTKREDINNQINEYYSKIRQIINNSEEQIKKNIQSQLETLEIDLKVQIKQKKDQRVKFKEWQNQILQTLLQLQSMDLIKSIDAFADILVGKQQNIIDKGQKLITELKTQANSYWQMIDNKLQYPKIATKDIDTILKGIIQVQNQQLTKQIIDQDNITSMVLPIDCQFLQTSHQFPAQYQEEVSLLDMTYRDKDQERNYSSITVKTEHIQNDIILDQDINKTALTVSKKQEEVSEPPRSFKKAKTGGIVYNKSLVNLHQNRPTFNSPSIKRKHDFLSRGTIALPKDKLKKSMFKVKDPQKFQKLLKSMENDQIEYLDFTGLEVGNNLVKDIFGKLKQIHNVKNIRLMKNSLNDECIPSLLESLQAVETINLAQNNFTTKILDELLLFARTNKLQKVRNIQLGQNNMNIKRCRDKVEELRRLGIAVSL